MNPIVISKQTARRFILGRQGLWPGRRWQGKQGVAAAIRACEAVQLDPLVMIARSQDIVLHSRVLDYKPEYLYQVMYKERKFFDYGGHLHVYPMSNLPYWRVHMEGRWETGISQATRSDRITADVKIPRWRYSTCGCLAS
jgi:uncharacterized protein YcaQ